MSHQLPSVKDTPNISSAKYSTILLDYRTKRAEHRLFSGMYLINMDATDMVMLENVKK